MSKEHCKVKVDFEKAVDYPLVKTKFGVYNSGIVPVEQYERDAKRLSEVNPECLRIDLAWGADWSGWRNQPVSYELGEIHYDYHEMDTIAKILNQKNIAPYWSYCYTPDPLQCPQGDWKSIPSDMDQLGEILANFVNHYRNNGENTVSYHEIGNEPDGTNFFVGGLDEYLKIYYQAAYRMRLNDPDAMIGGFAVESKDEWIPPFLEYIRKHKLPLDFFSFHFYGTNSSKRSTKQDLSEWLEDIRSYFEEQHEFDTTEFHLNEFNSFPIDYPIDGSQQRYSIAAALLRDYKYFLSLPYLTLVLWAQFMDSGQGNFSGMVSIDGHRKAVFNAYKIYSMMPVDRREVTILGLPRLDGMASSDNHKASLVLWNLTGQDQNIDVCFRNIPFKRGSFRLYRIDENHASWGDDSEESLVPVEDYVDIIFGEHHWNGHIPTNGVVYFEMDDGSSLSKLTPIMLGDVIRVLHYYPDRKSTAYADFDKNTWIARLGMVREMTADLKVGATVENLPSIITVLFEIDGILKQVSPNSILGVRIDYMVGEAYTESIMFHGPYNGGIDLFGSAAAATVPWGTKRCVDKIITVQDLSRFQVKVGELAPEHWSGRAQITVLMRDAGMHTRAKVIIR